MYAKRLASWLLRRVIGTGKPQRKGAKMGNSQATTDLTFIQTKELIDELTKRHDALVVAGIKFTNVKGGYTVTRFHHGHRYVCLGLMANVESIINTTENSALGPDNG